MAWKCEFFGQTVTIVASRVQILARACWWIPKKCQNSCLLPSGYFHTKLPIDYFLLDGKLLSIMMEAQGTSVGLWQTTLNPRKELSQKRAAFYIQIVLTSPVFKQLIQSLKFYAYRSISCERKIKRLTRKKNSIFDVTHVKFGLLRISGQGVNLCINLPVWWPISMHMEYAHLISANSFTEFTLTCMAWSPSINLMT